MHSGDTLHNQATCLSGLVDSRLLVSSKVFNKITNDSASVLIAASSDQSSQCTFGDEIGFLGYQIQCYGGSSVAKEGVALIDYGINPSHIQGPLFPIRSAAPPATRLPGAVFDLLGRSMDFVASKRQVNGIVIMRDKDGSSCRVLFPAFENNANAGR
jgi:hypothetical protein